MRRRGRRRVGTIDLKRITRCNLGIVRVGHFLEMLWF